LADQSGAASAHRPDPPAGLFAQADGHACDQRVGLTPGPTSVEQREAEVDYQVAAPAEMRTPNWHRAKIAQKECGWKDGDRGGSARMQKTLIGRKKKNRFDAHLPSHGRSYNRFSPWAMARDRDSHVT